MGLNLPFYGYNPLWQNNDFLGFSGCIIFSARVLGSIIANVTTCLSLFNDPSGLIWAVFLYVIKSLCLTTYYVCMKLYHESYTLKLCGF